MGSRSWISRFGPMIALTLAVAAPAMLFAQSPETAPAPAPTPEAAPAAAAAAINAADTAWILVSSALVLLMTPALAFFYGGLTRSKNMLNTMMMSFIALGVVTIVWALAGYSLAYGAGNAWIGDLSFLGMKGVDGSANGTLPHVLYFAFQATFAVITAALISGAIVERMKFVPYVIFLGLWSLLVYSPVCHWVWQANGWLFVEGALDFAGGTVVHINAAAAALVAALILGKRKDYGKQALLPHNVPFVLLGAGLLWFGWFGFNAGSALSPNAVASYAFVNTFLAPAATLVLWAILDLIRTGKVTGVGAATGIVVGLVAITPAAGFVEPMGALAIGAIATFPSYFAIVYRAKTALDDSLDVVAAHGLGGVTGAMLTAVFASSVANSAIKADYNMGAQLVIQAKGVIATIVYSGIVSAILLLVLKAVIGIRATDKQQGTGLDISQHGEEAYSNGEAAILVLPDEIKSASTSTSTQVAGAKA